MPFWEGASLPDVKAFGPSNDDVQHLEMEYGGMVDNKCCALVLYLLVCTAMVEGMLSVPLHREEMDTE